LRDIDLYNIAVPYGYKRGNYLAHPHYGMHVIYPAATMRTSVEEYSHFIIAHMNGGVYNGTRILKEDTVELMHTTHYDSKGWNYGLGWVIEKTGFFRIKEVGHSGGWPGVHTQVIIRPEKDTAIIIFTNCLDSELRMTFFESLAFTHIQNILFYKAKKMAS
jgi:CubicO group peptidase (beta-lactamase class C family)